VPDTKTVWLNPEQIAEQATARAGQIIEITLGHSEYEATDDERRLVRLGIDLGITSYVAALRAHTTAQEGNRDDA
jgi:hypothetical protein